MRKYRKMESQHLRLRRTKIRLVDFRTVKVIGKGAFGEVLYSEIDASLATVDVKLFVSAGAVGTES